MKFNKFSYVINCNKQIKCAEANTAYPYLTVIKSKRYTGSAQLFTPKND